MTSQSSDWRILRGIDRRSGTVATFVPKRRKANTVAAKVRASARSERLAGLGLVAVHGLSDSATIGSKAACGGAAHVRVCEGAVDWEAEVVPGLVDL
jgi:hypothetical protein